jgi:hypothetical protein
MGRLAQRIEEHAQAFVTQDLQVDTTVRGIVDEQTTDLTEQLELVREKVGIHGREQEQLRTRLEGLVESRMRGLAELVRSDSQALQTLIEERMSTIRVGSAEDGEGTVPIGFDETAVVRAVDDRMAALEHVVDERMGALERTLGEQVLAVSTATNATVERNLDRMSAAAGSVDGIDELVAETQQAFEDRMMSHIDDRMTAIARLIRSDNQVLAQRFATPGPDARTGDAPMDGELARQLLRTIKELQAGITNDPAAVESRIQTLSDQLHRESQSQAEAMLKVAEVLGGKIDRLSVRMDEGVGNDIQIVVDRMSDAIRAMSTVNRRDIA